MEPFLGGGEMISNVTTDGSTWADLPWKFEAGTPPIAEAIGLGAAADYLMAVGLEAVRAHERGADRPHARGAGTRSRASPIYGPRDPPVRGGAVSFSLPDIHPHDIAQLIDREGVCVRAGHHCAKPLMRVLGVGATARASTYLYNSPDEIDVLVRALGDARRGPGLGEDAVGGLDDLYQELILDHYRRKRGEGSLEHPTVAVDQNNPLCGDEIHLELQHRGRARDRDGPHRRGLLHLAGVGVDDERGARRQVARRRPSTWSSTSGW